MLSYSLCNLCPRQCMADRTKDSGFCGCGQSLKVARAALHFWEEPCISGKNGSGAVFFSGCNLKCCYCQNYDISIGGFGKEISIERLAKIFLELQDKGAHNINLVTPSSHVLNIIKALDIARPALKIPVVYNCGGYESTAALAALERYTDIYMPDLKFYSSRLSHDYSGSKDYFEIASQAVIQMIKQVGAPQFDQNGIMQKGVIIRHLVLPGARLDSIKILKWMGENLDKDKYLLSIMNQYTPINKDGPSALNRRVTTFEYKSVVEEAQRLNLPCAFIQGKGSADKGYTPPFDLEGV